MAALGLLILLGVLLIVVLQEVIPVLLPFLPIWLHVLLEFCITMAVLVWVAQIGTGRRL